MEITFYGVRGSVPAPATGAEIQTQIAEALYEASRAGARFESPAEAERWLKATLPFHRRSGYGGDTTCCYLRCGEVRIVIDAGSGIRRLGQDLLPELLQRRGLELNVLFTHMHLDHIVGFPFFAPLFAPRRDYDVRMALHGGSAWETDLQSVLSSTVSAPLFPVELNKLRYEAAHIEYSAVYDGKTVVLGRGDEVRATCRRLHHPNETYGWRIETGGKVFVFATDTEPYAGPDPVLTDLARGADVFYMDSQYDWQQYTGQYDDRSRVGWGHGYAEWCGRTAREAGAALAVSGHHDPGAGPRRVHEVSEKMRGEFPNTVTGWDGLRLEIGEEEIVAFEAGDGGEDLRVRRHC
jgi:phosphoribosyl 1,2-cyclic phosphodiesterase